MASLPGLALLERWAQRDDYVVLDAGGSFGPRFFSAWATWLSDPRRCRRLVYIALGVEGIPSCAEEGDTTGLHERLSAQWPSLTPGLHTLTFDHGPASQVTLLLGVGDVGGLASQLIASVDAFDLSGLPPQASSPNHDHGWLSRLARLAAPGSVALARHDDSHLLEALAQSSFKSGTQAHAASPLEPLRLHFQPHHTPPPLPGGLWPAQNDAHARHALVIGAGLAGCAAAWALARQGWKVTLVDGRDAPAMAASGNPGGLFHSIIHGEDGIHARSHRAAAMRTAAVVTPWLRTGQVPGSLAGLLRLDAETDAPQAQTLVERLRLPPDHVRWLDQAESAELSGLQVPGGGWLFKQGGWLDPAAYARALLDEAKSHAQVEGLFGRQVASLKRSHSAPPCWQALDADGAPIAEAPVVVFAGASDTSQLIDALREATALPLSPVRGQISSLPLTDGLVAPALPVAGAGYVLPAHQGRLLFGATSDADDTDPTVRDQDHQANLAQARQLGSFTSTASADLPTGIEGRVAWRAVSPDRLPYVGALPLKAAASPPPGRPKIRLDQPRFVPRLRDEHGGVHVITGLGSRGIAWAALAGELLASWITGSPCPVEAPLRDALDPARVVTRAQARQKSG